MKQDKTRIIIDETVNNSYLHISFFIELLMYDFATNRNPTCAELIRKRSSSGVLIVKYKVVSL